MVLLIERMKNGRNARTSAFPTEKGWKKNERNDDEMMKRVERFTDD